MHWVSAVVVLSLVMSGDYSLFVVWGLLCCSGFSCLGACSLGTQTSVVAAQWLSCSTASGIFPDQGLNQCLLHCKADSYKPDHQGSPSSPLIMGIFLNSWYLGIYESRWEEEHVKEDGTGWGRLWEQLWRCEGVRLDFREAEWSLVFLPDCGRCPQKPLMPCCWIGDYSQDIVVLSDVWILGSGISGALWTLSVPSLRVSSPLRSF